MSRFSIPEPGAPTPVTFPAVHRRTLANGLRVWATEHAAVPVVTVTCLVEAGTATDPPDLPGLASLTSALLTEGAGLYDAIQLSDALARIGAHLSTETGIDTASLTLTTLARHFDRALSIMQDVVERPRMAAADFERVRELRIGRLKQVARTPSAAADRALLAAIYGQHPYGHGALGTTRAAERVTLDDVRASWASGWHPGTAAILVAGDISPARALGACESAFGGWTASGTAARAVAAPAFEPSPAIRFVQWPDAPQSEIRVGHGGPGRTTADYHSIVALNAMLGGQFTSRVNRNLREERAITYGARTSFDMRRVGGLFSCDAAVQADATPVALAEVLREMRQIQPDGAITADELGRAQAALARGYGRHFETAAHLVRAMAELVTYGLPDDSFDRFVPAIEALTPDGVARTARAALHPDDAVLVVVGDRSRIGEGLESLARPLVEVSPEF